MVKPIYPCTANIKQYGTNSNTNCKTHTSMKVWWYTACLHLFCLNLFSFSDPTTCVCCVWLSIALVRLWMQQPLSYKTCNFAFVVDTKSFTKLNIFWQFGCRGELISWQNVMVWFWMMVGFICVEDGWRGWSMQ